MSDMKAVFLAVLRRPQGWVERMKIELDVRAVPRPRRLPFMYNFNESRVQSREFPITTNTSGGGGDEIRKSHAHFMG